MDTELTDIAKRLKTLDKTDIRNWLKRGELLSTARTVLGNDAGFIKWCQAQHIAKSTAYKVIAAFRDFGNVPTSGQFSKEAMAILSQSAEAREDAIDLSKHKRITARIARELVNEYLPATESSESTGGARYVYNVPGGVVIVKTERPMENGDILGMIATAAREVKDTMVVSKAA